MKICLSGFSIEKKERKREMIETESGKKTMLLLSFKSPTDDVDDKKTLSSTFIT